MKLGNPRFLFLPLCAVFCATGFGQGIYNSSESALPESSPAVAHGVVVETIKSGSASQQAGMQVGDVLLHWTRGDAEGALESPFDLSWAEIEQAPRGPVTVQGFRGTSQQIWTPRSTNWGLAARPNFSEPLLSAYLEAQGLAASGKLANAIVHLRAMANAVQDSQPSWLRPWLLYRAAGLLADARQWKEVNAAYEEVVRESEQTGPAVRAQLLLGWASTLGKQKSVAELGKLSIGQRERWLKGKRSAIFTASWLRSPAL